MPHLQNTNKVLHELYKAPTYRFHVRELARRTKLNPNTILTIISELSKNNTVKLEKKGFVTEITLNLEGKTLISKKLHNIEMIYSTGLIEFLTEKYNPQLISLIGSYGRGEDIEKSDIDLVIFNKNQQLINLEKFEKQLHRKIHLTLTSREKLSEEFFNNLINGIVLYGVLAV
ncbi:MAG: nucleotidyltransferase domain-containing protein [Candidatus Woesearchaeota archaeon]